MERFVLNFDEPIIGIVGPNGCGKSNIVDALRWVLGETHAKQLRGSVLDDVIFNGSDTRRPLGMAEVSITIRPDEGWFNPLRDEEEARMRELVAQTDASLSEDERALLETEQESSQEAPVPEDILRSSLAKLQEVVPGLFEAAEIQLTRRLYRSGESEYFINRVPCRLRDLVDFYRTIGLGARGLSIVQQGQIGEFISKKPTERRQLLEEAAGIAGFRVRIEAATRQLARTNDNIARLSDIIAEVDKQVRVLRRQANRAKRRDELKAALRNSEIEVFRHKAAGILGRKESVGRQQQSLEQTLQESQGTVNLLRADEERARGLLEELETELGDLRREKESLSSRIHQLVEERSQAQLAKAQLEGQLEGVRERLSAIDERKAAIGVEMQRRREAVAAAELQRGGYVAKLQELEAGLPQQDLEAGDALAKVEAELREHERGLAGVEEELKERQLERATLKGEIGSLERQLAEFKPGESEEELARLCEGSGARALFDAVRVSEEYSAAFAAIVSDRTVFVIGDSREELRQRFSELGISTAGVGAVGSDAAQRAAQSLLPAPEGTRRLVDCVEIEPEAQAAVAAIIGNVFLVEDLSAGFSALDSLGAAAAERRARAVTPSGEVVTPWGWYCAGASGSIYSSHARLEAKRERAVGVEQQVQQLVARQGALAAEEQELRGRLREMREAREERIAAERAVGHELSEVRAAIVQYSGQVKFEQERIDELREELRAHEAKRQLLIESEKRLREQNAEANAAAEQQSPDFEKEHELLAEQHELTKIIGGKDKRREELRLELSELLHQIENARRLRENLQHEHGEITLSADRLALELSMLHDDIQQRYGDSALLPTLEESRELITAAGGTEQLKARMRELEQEAGGLRQKLEREGDVDPEAVFLCGKEEERLEELQGQRSDLQQAVSTLDRTIRQLKEVSRRRFVATFESVNTKFQELVPRLFGGGAGYLELIDPDDPLTSGVELTVRPPGKKLRSLELMSGGEKALSATAILISMFLHRPSPICVLDEVDAPLDDANLERFLDLIKEIAETTQFLIITHNKRSMAAADKLIGITMQEKGVSTALTVALDEAERQLDTPAAINA